MNIQLHKRGVSVLMSLTFFFIVSGCVSSSSPPSNVIVSEPTKTKSPKPSSTPSISNPPASTQEVDYRCSNTTGINIRSGPGLNYDVVGWLLEGECVVVIETTLDGGWAKTEQGWLGPYYLVSSNDPISTQQIPTTLSTPTKTPIPTRTISPTRMPTSIPSTRPIPTQTPQPPVSPACSCNGNLYNCDNFSTQASAQACFEYCWSVVGYDIHWLDGDDDGIACEWNP